jgi:hypothetical protein
MKMPISTTPGYVGGLVTGHIAPRGPSREFIEWADDFCNRLGHAPTPWDAWQEARPAGVSEVARVKAKLESAPPAGGDAYNPLYSMAQIEAAFGVPEGDTSCPSCGIRYGYHLAGCAALAADAGVSVGDGQTFSRQTPMDESNTK